MLTSFVEQYCLWACVDFVIPWLEHFSEFSRFQGNLGQAELIGREALKLLPDDHTIMFSLANVLGKLQKYKVSQHGSNYNCSLCM